MAVTWTKTLRPNPPKRQRVALARVTQSRTKKVPFTHSVDPHGQGTESCYALPQCHRAKNPPVRPMVRSTGALEPR
jgi:hypothetical protein